MRSFLKKIWPVGMGVNFLGLIVAVSLVAQRGRFGRQPTDLRG